MNYNRKKFQDSEEVIKMLLLFDLHCKKRNINAELVLLGGSAILLRMGMLGNSFRPTDDIDIELISTNDEEPFYDALGNFDIHVVGGVIDVPPKEDLKDKEKLFKLDIPFSAIHLYVPGIELLACCKIFSTREKDLIDLKESSLLETCDKEELMGMIDEYKSYFLNLENPDLNLHQLVHILRGKGI